MNEGKSMDMTDTLVSTVGKLEERLDRQSERISIQLDQMLNAIDRLRAELTEERVRLAGMQTCPQPGLCLQLRGVVEEMKKELSTAQKNIAALTNWRAGIVMLTAVLVFLATIFAPSIRTAFGL